MYTAVQKIHTLGNLNQSHTHVNKGRGLVHNQYIQYIGYEKCCTDIIAVGIFSLK
jgi:hypothetical protein